MRSSGKCGSKHKRRQKGCVMKGWETGKSMILVLSELKSQENDPGAGRA